MTLGGQYYDAAGGIQNQGQLDVADGALVDLRGELRNDGTLDRSGRLVPGPVINVRITEGVDEPGGVNTKNTVC